MKKISSLIILFILLIYINACTGYKPIFGSTNLQFEITDYVLKGNKKLGNQIYSKLYNLSKANKDQTEVTSIYLNVKVSKDKNKTISDLAGKILGYKINLNTKIILKNYITDNVILHQNFSFSSSYKVQNKYSETIKIENKLIDDLISKTFQELLVQLTKNI